MSHFSDALRSAHSSLTSPSSAHPGRGRLVTGSAVALAAALGLAGCASSGAGEADGDQLQVVATTTQLTDFAQEIGGDDIALTGLLPAGGSAHHYDPSPDDLLALGQADVLIVNGAGLETFIDDAIEASGFDGTLVDASQGVDLAEAEAITSEAEHAAEHDHADDGHDHEHADEGDASHDDAHDHEHAESGDEEHDHDHGPVNPHLWTSPQYAKGMATEVMDGLVAADPDRADDFTSRGEAYTAKLDALDEWVSTEMAKVPEADRIMVSGHDSLRYYLHDYDIAFAGSILPSFEDNAEPSASEIDALVHEIEEQGVKAVFVESSMNPKLAETIAQEAGVEVVDSDSLYADSLGAEDTDAATYVGATVHNTQLMLEAWGVTPDAVPADLES
ncbi:metal ABC transporter substrate-binding protein [Leucobacter tardus]|uniref:Zinc ABC transporter substrate-binding protein n=1 Tax=Leucobacter tardus TaxID=501483 RepID=A0A939QBS1_9MICO|nr:metal ABC transporter substrate-binding protein [Leucobacter tardus]MBO2988852.1 zinc ABC transporter substrate-binding protein [Leucobacter tardus]